MTTDIRLVALDATDESEFLSAVRRSARLHRPWVSPPASPKAFREYLNRSRDRHLAYLVRVRSGPLAGVINVNEVVRGVFQSGYLGYYAFEPYAGQGLMTRALTRVLTDVFRRQKLHRVEANIQPGNTASLALVKRLGFELEGFSKNYLKIRGRWRDHERWALRAENWKPRSGGR